MNRPVLFIHGAGTGAYAADRLLADSLQGALGAGYDVACPQMPDEENVPLSLWNEEIDRRLAGASAPVALVGHSVGGSVLLKYLCERRAASRIAGLFVIAAPYWGGEGWQWDDATLPADAAAKLSGDWPLIFYYSRDDEIVPFAHLALYAAKLPRAIVRTFDAGGHQFGNDLAVVAADIQHS
jgi:serine hydrolase